MKENFRGIRNVVMVNVIEGDGNTIPFREVHYIFDMEQHGGSYGGFVGKIDTLEQIGSEVSNKSL